MASRFEWQVQDKTDGKVIASPAIEGKEIYFNLDVVYTEEEFREFVEHSLELFDSL